MVRVYGLLEAQLSKTINSFSLIARYLMVLADTNKETD